MRAEAWSKIHVQAWTLIKGMLLMRAPAVEESDLDDSSELKQTTCYAVIYLAYDQAQMLDDQQKARKSLWYRKMRKAFSEVSLTINSVTSGRESFSGRRSLRA
jgi:hypothetical protein